MVRVKVFRFVAPADVKATDDVVTGEQAFVYGRRLKRQYRKAQKRFGRCLPRTWRDLHRNTVRTMLVLRVVG